MIDRCRAAYLASEGNEPVLAEELDRRGVVVDGWHGRLALSPDPPAPAFWALDLWTAPELVTCASIGDAVAALRARQRNWSHLPVLHHRRSALIAARLPPVKAAALCFPAAAPAAPLGAWTLLAPDRMLLSPAKASPFPNGVARFVEDRSGPPSRAYLKLWEACARIGAWPGPGETCLDLGAAPGGWTWAIATLGAAVTAIDRAPLDPAVAAMPGVHYRRESAFGLDPAREPRGASRRGRVITAAEILVGAVPLWNDGDAARRIVCTVKFQDPTDHEAADAFAAIPGSRLLHLSHNRHELTWCWSRVAADHRPATGVVPDDRPDPRDRP